MAKKDEAKGEGEAAAVETTDSPLLDLTDAAVKRLLKLAKKRGWVTQDELNAVLPSEEISSDQIEDMNAMLSEMGINVVDSRGRGRGREGGRRGPRRRGERGRRARRDDPVDRGRDPHFGAERAHRRSGAHVPARDGLGRAPVARGRNRHRQAHRGRPRGDDRGLVREPADLPGDHHLAGRAQRSQDPAARHHRSRGVLHRPRRQEAAEGRLHRARRAPRAEPRARPARARDRAGRAARGLRGRGRRPAARQLRRRGRSRELDVALRHGGRPQAAGADDLRPHRRRLQEAAPPAGPERREQAQKRVALARAGAQVQGAEEGDRHRRQVAVAQPEPHRRAGRAALRHQQAADQPRHSPDAHGGGAPHRPRGLPAQLPELGARSEVAAARLEADHPRLEGLHRARQDRDQGHPRRDPVARPGDGPRDSGIPQPRPDGAEGRARGAPGQEGDGRGEPAGSSSRSPRNTPTAACSSST